jgi:hypothetical protein
MGDAGREYPGPHAGQAVLDRLHEALQGVLEGSGRMVLVHGPQGSERGELVWRLATEARKRHRRLAVAMGDAADPEHPAWRQIAFQLTAARRAGRALLRKLPEWLSILPLIGPVLGAGIETVRTVRRGPARAARGKALGTGSSLDQVRILIDESPRQPRLIVLQNLEASDAQELAGAFGLVQRLADTRTLFICTSVSSAGRPPAQVMDILREAERLGRGSAIEVAVPDPGGAAARHPGRMSREETAAYSESEVQLLRSAGELGPVFDTAELQIRLELEELVLQDRLARLQRRGVIVYVETVARGADLTDRYRFRDAREASRWAAAGLAADDLAH